MSRYYDEDAGLLWSPQHPGERHLVRESAWYALGIVVRQHTMASANASELDRVAILVENVLQAQWHAPGSVWHGTFRRAPEETDPPDDAVVWRDYDPNWRQFIGTTLLLLLRLEGDGLLYPLASRIERALEQCILGEPENRVPPTYTNIALMRAWLEVEMADRLGAEYQLRGLRYAREITTGFNENHTFAEYNSPTYYGINFFALGLWQHYSASLELRALGEEVTGKLWSDVARYYHAGMKNLCGPWSRSYGMDMQSYVAAIGLWIWAVTGEDAAPFPMDSLRHGAPLGHDHDFCLGPLAVISATLPSPDVLARLRTFPGSSEFTQVISTSPRRDAYVSLKPGLMMGLETADISYRGTAQYHPLTCHWFSGNRVNWFRLRFKGRIQGEIRDGMFDLTLIPDDGVDNCVSETGPGRFTVAADQWRGDGIVIQVATELEVKASESGAELSGIKRHEKLVLSPTLRK